MRIAIAGISHETNTYCKDLTTGDAFRVLRGDALLATDGQETDVGGMVNAVRALGAQPVPIMVCDAQPSGTIEAGAYHAFKQEILDGLSTERCDAVLLALHGAGVVEGIDDLEGDLSAAVRALVGADVALVATFDLHGNITQTMADVLNGVFACHQYPHIDMHHRSREAAELALRLVNAELTTSVFVETLPMLLPCTTTFEEPGKSMLGQILEAEAAPGIVDVSWFHGFPYTDIPQVGASICVTATSEILARQTAANTATHLWSARDSFLPRSLSAKQALEAASELDVSPVIINETSDNPGGGAPGDGTHLLRAMIESQVKDACFGFIVDPQSAATAHAAGVDTQVHLELGGHYDDLHGAPLKVSGTVRALHDGRLILQAMFKGAPCNLGPMARIEINGIDVIVVSRRSQTFDPEPFLAVGIDITCYKFVALKSSHHFRAGFKDVAAAIVTADTPGLCTHKIETFTRQRSQMPMWPVDAAATYPLPPTTTGDVPG